jgi:kynurenine formamidase
MIATITHQQKKYHINFNNPLDISMPLTVAENAARAWYQDALEIKPVVMGNWIGSVSKGASVNFNNIFFNPHAHGTHTECVGHISTQFESVNKHLNKFMFLAELITVTPKKIKDDYIILKENVASKFVNKNQVEALIIRTAPNTNSKLYLNYSNTNPAYVDADAIEYLNQQNIKHLLLDLPSVDREQDEGALAAHKAFWQYPNNIQFEKTITEMIYVDNAIEDGMYFLNLQIAPFENDASPSKPILYALSEII